MTNDSGKRGIFFWGIKIAPEGAPTMLSPGHLIGAASAAIDRAVEGNKTVDIFFPIYFINRSPKNHMLTPVRAMTSARCMPISFIRVLVIPGE